MIVNVDLARSLYKHCREEEYIRKEHLVLAAEVFRALLELTQKNKLENGQDNLPPKPKLNQ